MLLATYLRYHPKVTSHSLATLVHGTRIFVPLLSRHWCTGTYEIYEGQGIESEARVIAHSSEPAPAGLALDSSRLILTQVKQASDALERTTYLLECDFLVGIFHETTL